jgi:outer membrane protease
MCYRLFILGLLFFGLNTDALSAFDMGIHIGKMDGKSNELVFSENGNIVSDLKWPICGLLMAGFSIHAEPSDGFHINAIAWTKIHSKTMTSTDADFDEFGSLYSFSWSPTTLDHATILDFYTGYDLFECSETLYGGAGLRGNLGYTYKQWKWTARGGTLLTEDGFEEITPDDPNTPILTYEQHFNIPYIGLTGRYFYCSRFFLDFHARYSPLIYCVDYDEHKLRDILFEDTFSTGTYWGIGINLRSKFWENFQAGISYFFESIEAHGDIKASYLESGIVDFYDGGAGVQNYTHLLEFELSYIF